MNSLAAKRVPKRSFSSLGPTNPTPPCTLAQALARPPKQRRAMGTGNETFNAQHETLAELIQKGAAIGATSPKPLHPKASTLGPKGRQKLKLGHQKMDSDPGSVFESSFEHMERHRALGHTTCIRCHYLSEPKRLEEFAKLPVDNGHALPGGRHQPGWREREGGTWLEPRSQCKGGQWGLGCRACAWYRATNGPEGKVVQREKFRKHRKRLVTPGKPRARWSQARFSTFANFAWRRSSHMAQDLEQHGNSKAHETACRAMLHKAHQDVNTGKRSATPAPPTRDPRAEQTFKGRVPKPKDWLDGFVDSSNCVSCRKQAKLSEGKSGETPAPDPGEPLAPWEAPKQDQPRAGATPTAFKQGQPLAAPKVKALHLKNVRKRRRKQSLIFAECVRQRHREVLRKARFCSLALDEAQGRKLVRFRCDFHKPPWNYSGTLGVFKMGPKTLEEGEEDHALRSMRRLDEFITKFCTPLRKRSLGSECDQELKDHLLEIVKTISADGGSAERRAIFLACKLGFPA